MNIWSVRFLCIYLSIFLLSQMLQFVQAGQTVPKKTFCSMTLNSADEAALFKASLSPDEWNFVELAPEQTAPENPHWLRQACEKKVTCDILVISGHFAGMFFGSSSSTLSMDELETASCEDSCQGILHRPREVFLFGCNTLASKTPDRRTPEEFNHDLRLHGLSFSQASQVTAFRYSGFGESFKNRMSQVFAKVPRIYGFSSEAPMGSKISPLLRKYLQTSSQNYSRSNTEENSTQKNQRLFTALRGQSIVQTAGFNLTMKSPLEKPYCYIQSRQVSHLDKIRYVERLFSDGTAMPILAHIEGYLAGLKSVSLNDEEARALTSLTQNQKIKGDLLKLLELNGDIYIPLKANVLNTMKTLNFVDSTYVDEAFQRLIGLNSPFSSTHRDMICSLGLKAIIPTIAIPAARWSEANFLDVVLCLKLKHPEVQEQVFKILTTGREPNMTSSAIWYFAELKTKDPRIQTQIAKVLQTHKDVAVRLSAALVLRILKPTDSEVQRQLLDVVLREREGNVVSPVLSLIKELGITQTRLDGFAQRLEQAPQKKLILENMK